MRRSTIHRKSDCFVRVDDYFTTPHQSENDDSISLDSGDIPFCKSPNYSLSQIKVKILSTAKIKQTANLGNSFEFSPIKKIDTFENNTIYTGLKEVNELLDELNKVPFDKIEWDEEIGKIPEDFSNPANSQNLQLDEYFMKFKSKYQKTSQELEFEKNQNVFQNDQDGRYSKKQTTNKTSHPDHFEKCDKAAEKPNTHSDYRNQNKTHNLSGVPNSNMTTEVKNVCEKTIYCESEMNKNTNPVSITEKEVSGFSANSMILRPIEEEIKDQKGEKIGKSGKSRLKSKKPKKEEIFDNSKKSENLRINERLGTKDIISKNKKSEELCFGVDVKKSREVENKKNTMTSQEFGLKKTLSSKNSQKSLKIDKKMHATKDSTSNVISKNVKGENKEKVIRKTEIKTYNQKRSPVKASTSTVQNLEYGKNSKLEEKRLTNENLNHSKRVDEEDGLLMIERRSKRNRQQFIQPNFLIDDIPKILDLNSNEARVQNTIERMPEKSRIHRIVDPIKLPKKNHVELAKHIAIEKITLQTKSDFEIQKYFK